MSRQTSGRPEMLSFRVIGPANGEKNKAEQVRTRLGPPGRGEITSDDGSAATESSPATTENGSPEGEFSWPEMSEEIATLQIPIFAEMGALQSHGGPMFHKRGTRVLVRGNKDPVIHVAKSTEAKFPLDAQAHLPKNVLEVAQFASDKESSSQRLFRENHTESLEGKAARCRMPT